MKVAFVTKESKPGVREAITFLSKYFEQVDVYTGIRTEPIPVGLKESAHDILISYLSPWIIPKDILMKTSKWNINFHPGPPEYPGIGCFNFAIYNKEVCYGCTAHVMEPAVDTGEIIGVDRFELSDNETVESLSSKTYSSMLNLFKQIMHIKENHGLPPCEEEWTRRPYRRVELEELAAIDVNMSEEEVKARIRATYYKGAPAPFIKIKGHKFEYNPDR